MGQPSRKSSDLSHLCWFECMKANELTSSAPKTSGWRPARAEPARTMAMPPSKLAATTSATQVLSSHHELALCSSLTETHSLLPYCKQTPDHDKLQHALTGRCWAPWGLGWLHVAPGGTSELTAAALGVPDHRTLVAWKFGSTITKIVRSISHLCWFECMKADELHLECPSYIG